MDNKNYLKFYCTCRICECSFSSHCDDKELLGHIIEEHPNNYELQYGDICAYFKKSSLKLRRPDD